MSTTRSSLIRRSALLGVSGAIAVLVLAGCTPGPSASPTTTVTTTKTVSPTPTPTTDPSADGGSGSPQKGQCRTANLSAAATTSPEGGAAGSSGIRIVLTNTGTASCTLQGWPGLSLVGGGDGTQLGQPADFDRSSPHATVTLARGGTAHADATLAGAGNYDTATCTPTPADGFRIYPPGETASLFASMSGITGCASTGVHLLTEKALQPGS